MKNWANRRVRSTLVIFIDSILIFIFNFGLFCLLILLFFLDLEAQIEHLRDTQRKYSNILRLSRALSSHFYHVVQTQVLKLWFKLVYYV